MTLEAWLVSSAEHFDQLRGFRASGGCAATNYYGRRLKVGERFQRFGVTLLVVIFCAFPIALYGNPQPASASIVVSQPGGKSATIKFTGNDLAQVQRDAKYVWKKLGASTVNCCVRAKRVSSCIWVCCNGKKLRTCDTILVKALEELYKEEKP
jgi:hypothetical protein